MKRRADDVSLQNLIFDDSGEGEELDDLEAAELDNVDVDLDLTEDVELDNLMVTNLSL